MEYTSQHFPGRSPGGWGSGTCTGTEETVRFPSDPALFHEALPIFGFPLLWKEGVTAGVPESLLHCPFTLPPEHPPEFTCLPVAMGTIAPHCPTQPLLTALAPSIHSIALPGLSLPQRPPSVPQTYRVCSLHRAFTLPSPHLEVLPWPARMAPSRPSMSPQMPLPPHPTLLAAFLDRPPPPICLLCLIPPGVWPWHQHLPHTPCASLSTVRLPTGLLAPWAGPCLCGHHHPLLELTSSRAALIMSRTGQTRPAPTVGCALCGEVGGVTQPGPLPNGKGPGPIGTAQRSWHLYLATREVDVGSWQVAGKIGGGKL